MYTDNTESKTASKPEDYKELETPINNDLQKAENVLFNP